MECRERNASIVHHGKYVIIINGHSLDGNINDELSRIRVHHGRSHQRAISSRQKAAR